VRLAFVFRVDLSSFRLAVAISRGQRHYVMMQRGATFKSGEFEGGKVYAPCLKKNFAF